jgi:hypothetical protein
MADDAFGLARSVTEWRLDDTDAWEGAQEAVGDAGGQEVRCGIEIRSGRWIVTAPGTALCAVELTVAEVVHLLPAALPRGWAFNQARGYVAALAGEVHRRAAASVVAEPGIRMSEEQIFEAAERLARLASKLNEAAMAPVKTAAQELRPTGNRLGRGQSGQLGAGDPSS